MMFKPLTECEQKALDSALRSAEYQAARYDSLKRKYDELNEVHIYLQAVYNAALSLFSKKEQDRDRKTWWGSFYAWGFYLMVLINFGTWIWMGVK